MSLYRVKLDGEDLDDMLLRRINVGDTVARAAVAGRSAYLEIRKVTSIRNGKIYLDDSKVAIRYPCRLLVITSISVPTLKSGI